MRSRRWPIILTVGLIATLVAGTGAVLAAEEEGGGNNLATPVIFAEGYGLSGFDVDPADPTTTGMPGLLKPACDDPVTGIGELWGDSNTVTYTPVAPEYQLVIDGTVHDQEAGVGTATPGDYFLQPYTLQPLIPPEPPGTPQGEFGSDTCWEADWADGSTIDVVEADAVDVGDSLVRTLRSVGPNPVRVEFSLFQSASPAGTFQDGTLLDGYPMTQLWPPVPGEGKPPSVGSGERLEVWGTADIAGEGGKVPAEQATVFSPNARLTIDRLTWAAIPESFADSNLDGYPSGVIPDTFEAGYQDWVAAVEYDGLVGGAEGESGFSAEVNQGGRLLYGYNWGLGGTVVAGWYRLTLSIDAEANGVAANTSITGVNPDDLLADESEGGSGGSSKGFFPPTFVEDPDGNYLYIDVYIAPSGAPGSGGLHGKVTDLTSAPLGGKQVKVYGSSGAPVAMADTAGNGLFGIEIPAGTYNVGFADPGKVYYDEYFDNRAALAAADDVVVTAGGTTYIEAELSGVAPPGSGRIRGTVESETAVVLKGIEVTAYGASGDPVAETLTDANGNYALVLVEGTYRVGFSDPVGIYAPEFYNNRVYLAAADGIVVVDGEAVNASATLAKAAQIKGTVRGQFLGELVAGATVTATDTAGTTIRSVATNASGEFLLALPVGSYKIRTSAAGYVSEWYDNRATADIADVLTVSTSGVIDVDIRLFPADFFIDVEPDNIFAGDIQWLKESGITKGCNPPLNDRFCPKDPVTRAQMASFLVRGLGLTDGGDVDRFVDDDDSVHETDINRLAAAGITLGCNPPDNDEFCPNDPVTRAQMASFLVRGLDLTEGGDVDRFTDDDTSVHETDINRLAAAGITKGCNPPSNTLFCPASDVLREQMAAFLHRALG